MLLRPRQKVLVDKTVAALIAHDNTLVVAPTGAGKTIMHSAVLARMMKSQMKKACVLAHRDELTVQNESKFKRINPDISTSFFNASEKSWEGAVTFAMVQTLSRENNLAQMPALDVLVIDEAHHALAEGYMRVINHARTLNPSVKLLGMTATPNRGDKKGLRPVFSNVADQITVKELILSGHLVPPRTFVMNVDVQDKLFKVRKTALDYDMNAAANIMNTPPINEAVVRHCQKKAEDRQTVVFCSTVKHARDVLASFEKVGLAAAMIWGDMSNTVRLDTLAAYGSGKIQVIVNVAVLTEGWDHPPTSCIILLRPSSHKSAMIQMIGRGLRSIDPSEHPGIIKKDCIVLDFGTATLMHGSLEQDVQLEDHSLHGDAPYKNCPDCGAEVPLAMKECALCSYVWEIQPSVPIANFRMMEIDILKRSSFSWCELHDDGHNFIAAGFDAWGGVFLKDGEWYALGGSKKEPTKLLRVGVRAVCFAAADDWVNLHETESTAHKSRDWLKLLPTEKQLHHLPSECHNDPKLTRYKASALLTMKFNKAAIEKVLSAASVAR